MNQILRQLEEKGHQDMNSSNDRKFNVQISEFVGIQETESSLVEFYFFQDFIRLWRRSVMQSNGLSSSDFSLY